MSEKLWEELRRTFVEEVREPGGIMVSKHGTRCMIADSAVADLTI